MDIMLTVAKWFVIWGSVAAIVRAIDARRSR